MRSVRLNHHTAKAIPTKADTLARSAAQRSAKYTEKRQTELGPNYILCEELLLRGKENLYIYNDLALTCFLFKKKKKRNPLVTLGELTELAFIRLHRGFKGVLTIIRADIRIPPSVCS